MMSPGLTSSGRMIVSSPTAQLAVFTGITDQLPFFSLARSVSPAQVGQSKVPPLPIPSGIAIRAPQPLQCAIRMASLARCPLANPKEALDLAPVKADDDLAVDNRHRGRPHPELQQLLERLRILADIFRDERDAILRKKLFLLIAGTSPVLGVHDHLFRHSLLLSILTTGGARCPGRRATR